MHPRWLTFDASALPGDLFSEELVERLNIDIQTNLQKYARGLQEHPRIVKVSEDLRNQFQSYPIKSRCTSVM
jgi:hypothetical protein